MIDFSSIKFQWIQFYSNNATISLHHLTSHWTLCCPTTQRLQITVTSLHPA